MFNHRNVFLNNVAQTSPLPPSLHIVSADGCYLIDADGKKYIDLISGISVCNLGHNHPAIVDAITSQTKKYLHVMVYGELIQNPQTELAYYLSEILPPKLSSTYFVNSGTEAIEGALKLAKRFTGRNEIIAFKNSYHGSTHGAMSLMSDEYFKDVFRPLLPNVRLINFNSTDDLKHITAKTACVVTEIIKAEEGCIIPTNDFLKALRKRCTETGALFIADECQTGIGRTGKMFAFEHYQIAPDILVLGKAFGGGMPLAAFISTKEIMQTLTHSPVLGHMTTFGGHPVCCASSLASLKIISEEKIFLSVEEKEKLFRTLLVHPKIKSVSGKGLLLAVEFDSEELNRKVIEICSQNGLFTDWFLFAPNKMRIAPALNISSEIIEESCRIIQKSISF